EAKRVYEATVAEAGRILDAAKGGAEKTRDDEIRNLQDDRDIVIAELTSQLEEAKANYDVQQRSQVGRSYVAKMESEAGDAERAAEERTEQIGRLDDLRASLLERLPIKGLSIQDGEIFVRNKPFDKLSTSEQMKFALQLATLRAGKLGLVCVDRLESLDPVQMEAFEKVAAALKGLQFIVTRVTDGALKVRSVA